MTLVIEQALLISGWRKLSNATKGYSLMEAGRREEIQGNTDGVNVFGPSDGQRVTYLWYAKSACGFTTDLK